MWVKYGPLVSRYVEARGILSHWPNIQQWITFGCNNMSKFFDYQILADRFVWNLKKWKKLMVPFSLLMFYYWSWGHRTFPGSSVHIPYWLRFVSASLVNYRGDQHGGMHINKKSHVKLITIDGPYKRRKRFNLNPSTSLWWKGILKLF